MLLWLGSSTGRASFLRRVPKIECPRNSRGKDQWALENKKGTGDAVASITTISDYLKGGAVKQVVGETYDTTNIGIPSTAELPATVRLGTYAAGSTISSQ